MDQMIIYKMNNNKKISSLLPDFLLIPMSQNFNLIIKPLFKILSYHKN
jgi:hypothetical protein